jgi:hypothetical protein
VVQDGADVIAQPETEDDVERAFLPRDVAGDELTLLERVVAAVQIELASIRAADERGGRRLHTGRLERNRQHDTAR